MISNPRLYAVASYAPQPSESPRRRNIVELRQQKSQELETKKTVDRASKVLDKLESRVASYKVQIAALKAKLETSESRMDQLERAILQRMEASKLDHADGFERRLSTCPCPKSVAVDNESLIPREYLRESLVSEPDKIAIKQALENDPQLVIPGVHLTQRTRLIRK